MNYKNFSRVLVIDFKTVGIKKFYFNGNEVYFITTSEDDFRLSLNDSDLLINLIKTENQFPVLIGINIKGCDAIINFSDFINRSTIA